jgi:hypothetical protein
VKTICGKRFVGGRGGGRGDDLQRMFESLKIYPSKCCQIFGLQTKLEPSFLIQKYFATIYSACWTKL